MSRFFLTLILLIAPNLAFGQSWRTVEKPFRGTFSAADTANFLVFDSSTHRKAITRDGGRTWKLTATQSNLIGLKHLPNELVGYERSFFAFQGTKHGGTRKLVSMDEGKTWIESPIQGLWDPDAYFTAAIDWGNRWFLLQNKSDIRNVIVVGKSDVGILMPTNEFFVYRSADFIDNQIGMIIGGINGDSVQRTSDAGNTWSTVLRRKGLRSLHFYKNKWFLVSQDTLFGSSDQGQSWTTVLTAPLGHFINCASGPDKIIVGTDEDFYYTSLDTGRTWGLTTWHQRPEPSLGFQAAYDGSIFEVGADYIQVPTKTDKGGAQLSFERRINLGTRPAGESFRDSLTIHNLGSGVLGIDSVTFGTADFFLEPYPSSIAPNDSLKLFFLGSSRKSRYEGIPMKIYVAAESSPYVSMLTVRADISAVDYSSKIIDFGRIGVGDTAERRIEVSAPYQTPAKLARTSISTAEIRIMPSKDSVMYRRPITLTVQFVPATAGMHRAELIIDWKDGVTDTLTVVADVVSDISAGMIPHWSRSLGKVNPVAIDQSPSKEALVFSVPDQKSTVLSILRIAQGGSNMANTMRDSVDGTLGFKLTSRSHGTFVRSIEHSGRILSYVNDTLQVIDQIRLSEPSFLLSNDQGESFIGGQYRWSSHQDNYYIFYNNAITATYNSTAQTSFSRWDAWVYITDYKGSMDRHGDAFVVDAATNGASFAHLIEIDTNQNRTNDLAYYLPKMAIWLGYSGRDSVKLNGISKAYALALNRTQAFVVAAVYDTLFLLRYDADGKELGSSRFSLLPSSPQLLADDKSLFAFGGNEVRRLSTNGDSLWQRSYVGLKGDNCQLRAAQLLKNGHPIVLMECNENGVPHGVLLSYDLEGNVDYRILLGPDTKPTLMHVADDGTIYVTTVSKDSNVTLFKFKDIRASVPNQLGDGQIEMPPAAPNPWSKTVRIFLPSSEQGAITVELVDILGRTLEQITTTDSYLDLNRPELPAGVYLVRFLANNRLIGIERLVKQ